MAAPSGETLQRIASETGLPAATLEKVLRLLDVLQAIAADRMLKTRIALKGGTALVRAGVLAWGAAGRRDWREASLDDIGGDPKELRQKLAIRLPRDFFAGAGGVDRWIGNSIALCRAGLAPLFERSAGETAFLDRLLDAGEIDPSGLGVAEDVKARIAAMPMLVWKAQNVRHHNETN